MKNKLKETLIILTSLLVITIFLYNLNVTINFDFMNQNVSYSEQKIINNCNGLNLKSTAYCLTNSINKFYKYNNTNDYYARTITIEEIQKIGTDCGGYSYLYERLSDGLGFTSKTYQIDIDGEDYSHRIMIMSNEEGYCILDQQSYECFMFE